MTEIVQLRVFVELNRNNLMIRCFKFVAVAFASVLALPVLAMQGIAQPADVPSTDVGNGASIGIEPTLRVGSVAPDLNIEYWFSRGTGDRFPKVSKFESGKVYVVEFWATWCPPCVASMPHLSELQKKYSDSVQIISVTDEPYEQVEAFLQRKVRTDPSLTFAQLTKNYCLTTDPDQSSRNDYPLASGDSGIPTAFLVGKSGRIEWIGHPMAIDEPLEMVVADRFDALAYQKEQAEREERQMKLDIAVNQVLELAKFGRANEALASLDEIIATAHKDDRRSLEYLKVDILSSVGKPRLAVKQLDKLIEDGSGEELTELKLLKFQIMSSEGMPGTEKLFSELANLAKTASTQNAVAWSVVQSNLEGNAVKPQMIAKARALADAAVAVEPIADVLETQAHLAFMQGDVDRAIAIQKRAIADAREPQFLKRLNFFLDEWQNETTARVMETESGTSMPEPRR